MGSGAIYFLRVLCFASSRGVGDDCAVGMSFSLGWIGFWLQLWGVGNFIGVIFSRERGKCICDKTL